MEYLTEIIVGLIITVIGGLILHFFIGGGKKGERKTLKITEEAKDNDFIDCEINGATEVSGQETRFLRTKFFDVNREISVTQLIFVLAALATIFSVVWGVYVYYSSNDDTSKDNDDSSSNNIDLRNQLAGYDSVFDFVSEIHSTDLDIDRKDLVDENLSKVFIATSTMLELGKFDSGNLWVTMQGTDSNRQTQVMECHFDESWENTVRNLFNTEKQQVKFKGKIAFYEQYWLVADDCEIVSY